MQSNATGYKGLQRGRACQSERRSSLPHAGRRADRDVWWIADYTDGSGKRHQERFKRKAEAVAHEEKSKVAIRAGTHVSLDSNLTVADVAEKWIKRVEANARERTTVKQYKEHIKLHILPRIGAVKLAKLSKATSRRSVTACFKAKRLSLDRWRKRCCGPSSRC